MRRRLLFGSFLAVFVAGALVGAGGSAEAGGAWSSRSRLPSRSVRRIEIDGIATRSTRWTPNASTFSRASSETR